MARFTVRSLSPLALDEVAPENDLIITRNKNQMRVADVTKFELLDLGGRMAGENEAIWRLLYYDGMYLYTKSFIKGGYERHQLVKKIVETLHPDEALEVFHKAVEQAEPGTNYYFCSEHPENL